MARKTGRSTTRSNLSIPVELKARMDAVDEPVNWSAVACRAFELKLAEIDSRREVKSMDDVINRLRASKQQSDEVVHEEGHEAGRQWAMTRAEAIELERLEELYDRWRSDLDRLWNPSPRDAYGPGEAFVFTINPEHDGDRKAAEDFWEERLGEYWESFVFQDGYVQAFAEGALGIWRDVKAKL